MEFELRIDSLAQGGSGVGRLDGKAVFVPLTAPGDLVQCSVVRDKKRYCEAELVRLIEPSELRAEPLCPVFGQCGGCQWQHLSSEAQSLWKHRIFADHLQRQCGVDVGRIRPLLEAADPWHYRSRVQFKCRLTEKGFVMGFYRRGSHYVIDVPRCPIARPEINGAMELLRRWVGQSSWASQVPQIDLGVDDAGRLRAVVHFIGEDAQGLERHLGPLAEAQGLSLFLQTGRKQSLSRVCGQDDLHIRVDEPPLCLAYGPGGFAQVNLEQNRAMVAEALRGLELGGSGRVLDLYCGMGNFSLPLARRCAQVVGVEDFGPSIEKARFNAAVNGIANAEFHARPAQGAAWALGGGFDLVVLDPPRTGAYDVARELCELAPRQILYISCDPATLARDLVPLLHGGFELVWSRPVDLFPQTFHTESLSLLRRKGAKK